MTNLEKAERYDDAYKRLVELCDKRDDLLSQLADVKGKILTAKRQRAIAVKMLETTVFEAAREKNNGK